MTSPAKTELRRTMRAQLALMTPANIAEASESIRTSIPSLPRWQESGIVAAFAALNGEPDLCPWDWAAEKTVLLPRVEGDLLVFHQVYEPEDLEPGAFGVMEPNPQKCPAIDPREAGIIFVPGLAFTSEGKRLGRGRGYYDRLLANLPPSALRVGVCFHSQIIDSIETEAHDEDVDLVLSLPV